MNWKVLLELIKGSNVWQTVSKVMNIAAGFVAGIDTDNKGEDDLAADILLAAADGFQAYGDRNYNLLGEIIDSIIVALTKLKQQFIANGRIGNYNTAQTPTVPRR